MVEGGLIFLSRVLHNARNQIIRRYNFLTHRGVDVVKEENKVSEILSHSDGVVFFVGNEKNFSKKKESYGNFVILEHENGYFTLYAHLEKIFVVVGECLKQGDIIGIMGASGTKHSHLHFEVRNAKNKRVNPTKYLDAELPKDREKTAIRYQIYDNKEKKWLPLVRDNESYAGIFGNPIGAILIQSSFPIKYKVYQQKKWRSFDANKEQDMNYIPIYGFKIICFKNLVYRVHFVGTQWSNWICAEEENKILNKKRAIDAIQIRLKED